MKKLRYTFKTDVLFKMLFVKHQDLLRNLVAALLGIAPESIGQFTVRNPEIPPEFLGDKLCRLDINMTVNNDLVDLEIQVGYEEDYVDRALYYWSRDFSTSLPAGVGYSMLPRAISINILDFNLFNCTKFHTYFYLLDPIDQLLMTNKEEFHFFELKKCPKDINGADALLMWLSLFRAETEEDLQKIKKLGVPTMNQAIEAYYSISASPEFRELERMRERAIRDRDSALWHAEQKGIQEGMQKGAVERSIEIARNALQMRMPIDDIVKLTGLAREEVERLKG